MKKLIGLYKQFINGIKGSGSDWATWFWILMIGGLWIIAFTALTKAIVEDLNPNSSPPIEIQF